jgi:hypothetical protein
MSLDDLKHDLGGDWAEKFDVSSDDALKAINFKNCINRQQYQRIVDDVFTRIFEELRCTNPMPEEFDPVLEAEMLLVGVK